MTSPLLWYLNRATGVVVLVLLTVVVVLGVLSTFGRAGRRTARVVPTFVTQALHRQLTAVAVALLVGHVVSAVADEYVDIRWWQVVVPFGSTYRPLWLGLGTVAFDLICLLVVTSLVRVWLGHRRWWSVHVLAYLVWALAVAHGLGIGTDTSAAWSRQVTLGCAVAVGVSVLARVATRLPRRTRVATR